MITDLPVFDVLPDLTAGAPDPLVAAAVEKFEADNHAGTHGALRPEPALSFLAGQSIVVRDGWGELLGRILISEINPQI